MKHCSCCGQDKGLDQFSKNRRAKDGLFAFCKPCARERKAAWAQANKEHVQRYAAEWRAKNPAYHADYRVENKEHERTMKAEWRAKNAEHVRQQVATWAAANRERRAVTNAAWIRNNRERHNTNAARYRAAKYKAMPAWADVDAIAGMYELAQVFRRAGLDIEVDHVVPLRGKTVCGLHTHDNLQLLIGKENASKQHRWTEIW